MSTSGLIAIAVLSGGLLAAEPDGSALAGDENAIPMTIGESYLFEIERDVSSVQIKPATAANANLVNPRTIIISGQVAGTGDIMFLDGKGEQLFRAKIKVAPRLWGQ